MKAHVASTLGILLAMVCTAATSAEGTAAPAGCVGFRFDLQRELRLFAGASRAVDAAATADIAAVVQLERLYAVSLKPQADVRFAHQPGKLTVADGSFAGLLRLVARADGTLVVTSSEAAWIDVLANGQLQESIAHTGSASCPLLHKSVQFAVKKGQPLLLQISGSTVPAVKLALTARR